MVARPETAAAIQELLKGAASGPLEPTAVAPADRVFFLKVDAWDGSAKKGLAKLQRWNSTAGQWEQTSPDPVTVRSQDDSRLEVNRRYLANRYGYDSDDRPVYVAVVGGGSEWVPVRITDGAGNCGPYSGYRVRRGSGTCGWESFGDLIGTIHRHFSGPADAPKISGEQIVVARPVPGSTSGEWECAAYGSVLYAAEPTGPNGTFADEDRNGFCYLDDFSITLACGSAGLVFTTTKNRKFADFRKTKARDLEFKVEVRDCT